MKRAERSTIFMRKLTTRKCQELHCSRKTTRTPHACIMRIARMERESSAVPYWDCEIKTKSFAHRTHHLSCFIRGCMLLYVGQIFRFLGSFWERRELSKCSMTCYSSRQLGLVALRCRALIGTRVVCCFVQGWLRLACAVFCGSCSTTTNMFVHFRNKTKQKLKKKKSKKKALLQKERKEKREKGSLASNRRRRYWSGSSWEDRKVPIEPAEEESPQNNKTFWLSLLIIPRVIGNPSSRIFLCHHCRNLVGILRFGSFFFFFPRPKK